MDHAGCATTRFFARRALAGTRLNLRCGGGLLRPSRSAHGLREQVESARTVTGNRAVGCPNPCACPAPVLCPPRLCGLPSVAALVPTGDGGGSRLPSRVWRSLGWEGKQLRPPLFGLVFTGTHFSLDGRTITDSPFGEKARLPVRGGTDGAKRRGGGGRTRWSVRV
jgi:hypothetical protein